LEEFISTQLYSDTDLKLCGFTVYPLYSSELRIVMYVRFCVSKWRRPLVREQGKTAPVWHGSVI
jgi:hypothetical protein